MHHYAASGPIGASVHPGPRHRPELAQRQTWSKETTAALEAAPGPQELGARLGRAQQHCHDHYHEILTRNHERALSGSIFGQHVESASNLYATSNLQRTSCIRKKELSPTLMAAGVASTFPMACNRQPGGL
mmetsp:Transcript_68790/g.201915  ORF Transcript_68790/g.201915 Transcript_68790/m.201915 type:complete len:131 (+) Transcript_68790:70-462(+)